MDGDRRRRGLRKKAWGSGGGNGGGGQKKGRRVSEEKPSELLSDTICLSFCFMLVEVQTSDRLKL